MFAAEDRDGFDRLEDEIRLATAAAPGLFAAVVAEACSRTGGLRKAGKAARIDRLIESGAFTDAALALIALELPAWTLRRLVRLDGQWLCSLSQRANLPVTLDDTADASHEVLPLAILLAFLQARRMAATKAGSAVPNVIPAADCVIACDNFA